MRRAFQIILLLVALGAGPWLWKTVFPSDETRILGLLKALADDATLPAGEGNIGRIRRIERLTSALTPDIAIRVTPFGSRSVEISGRDEVMQAAMAARGAATSIKVEFLDIVVNSVDRAAWAAEAVLTAKIQAGTDRDFGIQPLKISLRKEKEFGWRISRIESTRILNPE